MFVNLLSVFDNCRSAGLHIAVICHCRVETVNPPEGEAYTMYTIKINAPAKQAITAKEKLKEWGDAILFCNYVTTFTDGGKAKGGELRAVYTEHRATWEAKNRHGMPAVMAMDAGEISRLLFGAGCGPSGNAPAGEKQAPPPAQQEKPAPSLADQLAAVINDVPGALNFLAYKKEIQPGQGLEAVSENSPPSSSPPPTGSTRPFCNTTPLPPNETRHLHQRRPRNRACRPLPGRSGIRRQPGRPAKILSDIAGPRPAPATELLRPSLLPKLAQCPCYVSSPDAGEAAQRGTRMDAAFRALLMGVDEFRACEHLKADEKESILWAVKTVRTLCSGEEVIADKTAAPSRNGTPRDRRGSGLPLSRAGQTLRPQKRPNPQLLGTAGLLREILHGTGIHG